MHFVDKFVRALGSQILVCVCCSAAAFADAAWPLSPTNIFAPASTPAKSIFGLSLFVLAVTGAVFLVVFILLLYSVVKFRKRKNDDGREPPQVYGSNQVELAWTIIPILIVVTADELHVPVSDPAHPTPTFIKLLSADTDHSFWVPRLAGKTDLIPNHPNSMWIDPHEAGLYLGQCAQYCGAQHAKMLLRVYVQPRNEFDHWIQLQLQPASTSDVVSQGRRVFETTACINCHTVAGTVANGRFGP